MRELIKILDALSDETRLRMVTLLSGGELCVCEIMQALDISQTRASRNLGILRDAGLLVDRREGQWVYYSLSKEVLARYSKLVKTIEESLSSDRTAVRDRESLSRICSASTQGARCRVP
jgi:ArsR family transcriptional regulator